MKRYFVILRNQNGDPVPMVKEDEHGNDELATYKTRSGAISAASKNILGDSCGFEVFTWEPAPF